MEHTSKEVIHKDFFHQNSMTTFISFPFGTILRFGAKSFKLCIFSFFLFKPRGWGGVGLPAQIDAFKKQEKIREKYPFMLQCL